MDVLWVGFNGNLQEETWVDQQAIYIAKKLKYNRGCDRTRQANRFSFWKKRLKNSSEGNLVKEFNRVHFYQRLDSI